MDNHAVRRPLGVLSGNTLNGRGKTERDVAAKRVIVNKRVTNDGRNQRGLVIIAKIILRISFKKWSHNIYTSTTTPSYVDIISHGMTANKESIFEVDDATVDASVGATTASENVGEDDSQNIKQDIITPKKRRFYSSVDDDVIEINTTATSGGIRTNRSNIGTPLTGGIRANNLMNTTTPLPLFGINKNSSNHTTPTGILQFPSAINSINRVDNKENTPTRVSNQFENIGPNKIPAPLEKLIDENEINEEIEAKRHVEKKDTPKPASPETEQPTVANTTPTSSNNTTPEFPLAKDFEALHYAMVEATTASIKSLLLHHNARSGGSGSKFLQTRETVSYIETEYQEFAPNIDIKSVADSIKPVILSPLGHQGQPSGSTPYVPLCELSIYQDKVKLWKEKYGKEEKSNNASDANTTDKTVKSDDVHIEKEIDSAIDSFVTTLN